MSTRPRLVHRVVLRASPALVWRSVTDPRFTEQYFFSLRVKSDWKVGARIVWEKPDGSPWMEGEILEIEPGRVLRHSVRVLRDAETAADLPSRVTWELAPHPEGCELTVIHDEFETRTASYEAVARGWPTALRGLEQLLETGRSPAVQKDWPDHIGRPEPRTLPLTEKETS